jgi:hypothetical protein
MKNILLLIILQLSFFGIINAQFVTQESYQKAINYLNCKSVELSLKSDEVSLNKFKDNCNCEIITSIDSNKILKSIPPNISQTRGLSQEFAKISKLTPFEDNMVIEDCINLFTDEIFNNSRKYEKIFDFADRHQINQPNSDFKQTLKLQLKNILKIDKNNTSQIVDTNNQFDTYKSEEDPDTTQSDDTSFLGGLADYLILICLLLVILLLIRSFGNSNAEGKNYDSLINRIIESRRMNEHFAAKNNFSIPTRNEVSKDEIRDINNRIRDLEASIQNLTSKLSTGNQPPSIGQSGSGNTSNSGGNTIIKDTEQNYFYLSTPNTDGSFNESSASPNFKEGASIYRFTKLNANKAIFQIDDRESSIRLALQFPDKSIDPVCDATNAFNPKAIKIKTDQPGEVELQNGKWRVTKKSKIRYDG